MRGSWRTRRHTSVSRPGLILALALSAVLLGPHAVAPAQDTDPNIPPDGVLMCEAANASVRISWNIVFIRPIAGWLIRRDGQDLVKLPFGANEYIDTGVQSGEHVYDLLGIDFDDSQSILGTCKVDLGDTNDPVRCRAEGNEVLIQWGPALPRIAFDHFRIDRNGETIATLPPDQLEYRDLVFDIGTFEYTVTMVTGDAAGIAGGADGGLELGRCKVHIECFGVKTGVEGLKVLLDWSEVPLPEIALPIIFTVVRDGEAIAKTPETTFVDTVPSPGRYTYMISMGFDLDDQLGPPERLIAICRVGVPGDGERPPAPRDLRCLVAVVDPEPVPIEPVDDAGNLDPNRSDGIDEDGDGVIDAILPRALVSLQWENPVSYDRIIISRNKAIIAILDGDTTRYTDRPLSDGTILYGVQGIVDDRSSAVTTCEVEVPVVIVPPPRDLTCAWLSIVLDPDDPANPEGPDVIGDVIPVPMNAVVLRWWNPVRYARLLLARDGQLIATLPGSATMYRDFAALPGTHVYSLRGVLADGRSSRPVECRVEVGGEPVPPIEELRCAVIPSDAAVVPPPSAVVLSWEPGGEYDAIVVYRNNTPVVELPGDAQRWVDAEVAPGFYLYSVIAVRGGKRSPPVSCQVVVEGPPQRNLLYFNRRPTVQDFDPAGNVIPPANDDTAVGGQRLTSLADNVAPLLGWSFGVATDPTFVRIVSHDLDNTATGELNGGQGPDFLLLDIVDEGAGVVMAAVISNSEPFESLPVDRGHRLLNLDFEAGPSGRPGSTYEVRYTNTVGEPPVEVLFVFSGREAVPATLPGFVTLTGPRFLRGDVNGDLLADMTDVVIILEYLFLGGEKPGCLEAANVNGSTSVNLADPIFLLEHEFLGKWTIPAPYPECGFAPAPLGCVEAPACEGEGGGV